MAYEAETNPVKLEHQCLNGSRTWFYSSADVIDDVNTDGYFSNADHLGIKAGDEIKVHVTGDNSRFIATVLSVDPATGAADISDGLAIGIVDAD